MTNRSTAKDGWDRLSQVVEESGLTLHSFAMAIGLLRSETLYQIRRGQIGISNKVADSIIAAYPQYNKAWLLTGFGNKYADPSSAKGHIPFYNCNLSQIINIDHIEPESYIFLPMASSADFAIIYHGEDMMPSIPSGTVLLLSKCDPRAVVYGNEYVVCGLAEDERGYVGELYISEPISFVRGDVGDAAEFVELYKEYVTPYSAVKSVIFRR